MRLQAAGRSYSSLSENTIKSIFVIGQAPLFLNYWQLESILKYIGQYNKNILWFLPNLLFFDGLKIRQSYIQLINHSYSCSRYTWLDFCHLSVLRIEYKWLYWYSSSEIYGMGWTWFKMRSGLFSTTKKIYHQPKISTGNSFANKIFPEKLIFKSIFFAWQYR